MGWCGHKAEAIPNFPVFRYTCRRVEGYALGKPDNYGVSFMRIGVPKEVHEGEKRVAATPDVVVQLKKLGFGVQVESSAGAAASCVRQ